MKTALNLVSLAALAALGGGIWLGTSPHGNTPAETVNAEPDPAPVADTIPEDPAVEEADSRSGVEAGTAYAVEGTLPGYFIANSEVRFGDHVLENVMANPAYNGFEAEVALALEDTSQVAGSNDRGDYYEAYAMNIETYAITPEGVSITASHAELGSLAVEGEYVAEGYAAWTAGADAVGELFIADVTLNGETVENVSFAFWVGD
jgi:hypothetical protein